MQPSITWIGHSTVLIELDGVRLLTDPLLRPRVAHLRRAVAAPNRIEGELDAILLSHVHYDHLDVPSLRRVEAAQVIAPRGAGRVLGRNGFAGVIELGEGDEIALGSVAVVATRAEHSARRGPFSGPSPALGYLIGGSARVYFAGDTDLFAEMHALRPGLDVALLPVWGWGHRLPPGHLDPRRAAEALRLLAPRVAIPIHWGTYRRVGSSRDPAVLREPAERFEQLAAELAPEVTVRVLAPGERIEIPLASASEAGDGRA